MNKLIEQYELETGKTAKVNVYTDSGNCVCSIYGEPFVFWLASRPTCGVEQRKFLDEVEKFDLNIQGIIMCGDFKADIKKVIKGE